MRFGVKKLCILSVSVALSMILSFVESQIPPLAAVPGVKIGLANVVTVFLLYSFGWREAGAVSLVRIFLSALLFGSFVSMLYSLSGAALSFVFMLIAKRIKCFSQIGVSVLGGVMHNVGQIICAVIILDTVTVAAYLPILLISGVIGGIVVGILGGIVGQRLEKLV